MLVQFAVYALLTMTSIELSGPGLYAMSLFPNCALCLGLSIITRLESTQTGAGLSNLFAPGLEVLHAEQDFRRYQSGQPTVFAAHTSYRAAVCLHVAHIAVLRAFRTDWYLRKLSSAHKTSNPGSRPCIRRPWAASWAFCCWISSFGPRLGW